MQSRLRQRPSAAPSADASDPFEVEALSYVDGLYGAAMRLTRNPSDAEDLVQETFFRAFRAAGQFERGTNLKAWLFTILHNTFRNQLRHAGRNPIDLDTEAVERAPTPVGRDATPEQQLMRNTLSADLQAALDAVSPVFRQAVWLRDVEEFTYAEISEMLEVPVGTVMSRISRGRRALFEHLTARRPPRERTAAARRERP